MGDIHLCAMFYPLSLAPRDAPRRYSEVNKSDSSPPNIARFTNPRQPAVSSLSKKHMHCVCPTTPPLSSL